MSSAAIRAATLHMLPAFLSARDLDAEPIFRQCGMAVDDVGSPRIVARSQIHHVLKLAAAAVGTAEIGLLLGAAADPDKLGPTGSAMKAGATLASCLRAHMQSMPGMQSHVTLGLRREGTAVALTHRLIGDDETAWLLYEGAAAFHIRMLRHLLGSHWAPERVSFPNACKGRRLAYEEFFGAPVAFGQHDETRILFAQDLLSRPLRGRSGLAFDTDLADLALAPLDGFRRDSREIEIAVARMIETTLPTRPIGLAEAAAVLGLRPVPCSAGWESAALSSSRSSTRDAIRSRSSNSPGPAWR